MFFFALIIFNCFYYAINPFYSYLTYTPLIISLLVCYLSFLILFSRRIVHNNVFLFHVIALFISIPVIIIVSIIHYNNVFPLFHNYTSYFKICGNVIELEHISELGYDNFPSTEEINLVIKNSTDKVYEFNWRKIFIYNIVPLSQQFENYLFDLVKKKYGELENEKQYEVLLRWENACVIFAKNVFNDTVIVKILK